MTDKELEVMTDAEVEEASGCPVAPRNMPPGWGCDTCGNLVHCTCNLANKHMKDCAFRRALLLPFNLDCEHGFQACPKCDACTCNIGQLEGVR